MATKRFLTRKELELVVINKDLTTDRRLRKHYQLHIGRTTRKGGRVRIIACGEDYKETEWSYPMHSFMLENSPVCGRCIKRVLESLSEEDSEWFRVATNTPASNTGVN